MSEENNVKKDAQEKYEIHVKLSGDYYEAFISIESHDYDSVKLTEAELIEALKTKNVTFGIDYKGLADIIENPRHASDILVAKGVRHENGVDGKITYHVDIDSKTKPKELDDGTVDFKDIDFVHSVNKGQVLASRTSPTEGKKGTTVTNRTIMAKMGKIVNFKFGKNVELSDDEVSISSSTDGTINFDGEKISIIEVLEVRGDVGVKTGNIKFSGKVMVFGNVTTGYIVESDDDIEITGIVESAELYAEGSIVINGGVQGNDNCIIKAGGSIKCNYLNNCKVTVGKEITTNSIMHCEIVCDDSIYSRGKKGLIIGGDIVVRHHIFAKTIGSDMGTITKLRLGINSEIMEEFQDSMAKVKELKESIKKIDQALNLLKKQHGAVPDKPEIKAILDKTRTTKVEFNNELVVANKVLREVSELIESLRDSKIEATSIYPGVKIKIGNSYYNVKDHLEHVCVQKDRGEIIVTTI